MGRYQFKGMCVEPELLATLQEAYGCVIYVVIYNRKHIGCVDIPDAYPILLIPLIKCIYEKLDFLTPL